MPKPANNLQVLLRILVSEFAKRKVPHSSRSWLEWENQQL
jgi:hypothetical protein